ncbi:ATP-dependent DNA helicase [Anaerococcus prevotii]|uniref:DNA 3'-5' helicase n=1 Tax=Anaerococcus prevotii ACS-065-V-Col13 TaxID=879305 RepID=F0GXS6_9FIRM|nr:UvrD-helicase domain-containing protein [Anaerococcus prevotii]EGC81384.1 UvrD/REP helicase [Anaerococcus prevotii ACS-065-V-Col13]
MRNLGQEKIIKDAKLPAVVLAGPGTGKTHTIVNFVAEGIKKKRFDANKVLITTFTKKAAKELNTRIITKLKYDNIKVDLKDMMIGNFHSLAIDFIKKYRKLDDNFFNLTVIDSYMEEYIIKENLDVFRKIDGFDDLIRKNQVATILDIFQTITNNLVDLEDLRKSSDDRKRIAYDIYMTYEKILNDLGLINFQLILKRFYDLLIDPVIGDEIRENIDLVIIDEYQDTNLIQEEIAFRITKDGNIIVFGDDDQALYSFRGADPRNLLDFSERFYQYSKIKSTTYKLDINYRSNQFIVKKSKDFIDEAKLNDKKDLVSVDNKENTNTIVRARSANISNIVAIVKHLSKEVNLNQIAFLFPSFYNSFPKQLEKGFEKAGIKVINRKSDKYFYRKEVRFFLYILLKYRNINQINVDIDERYMDYYQKKKNAYRKYLASILEDENLRQDKEIDEFIGKITHKEKISEIIYKAIGLKYYKNILRCAGDEEKRVHKNTGKFINLGVDFDEIFAGEDNFYEKFIFSYLYIFYDKNAISEYDEDDSDIDGVNFMTIHQAKGLEFEVVFVSSLNDYPRGDRDKFLDVVRKKTREEIDLDFYRKYYTAFTRAKNLLVLFDNSRDRRIQKFVNSLDTSSRLSTIDFRRENPKREKEILAFTTDIDVYKTCPRKYKFIRKLSYKTYKNESLIFGSRVHALTEYIYSDNFNKEDMGNFLKKNPIYINPVANLLNKAYQVKNSEVNYKTDRNFYILQGSLDLVLSDNTIVDLKTGSFDERTLDKYANQLITYKNLMEENGEKVKETLLYFIEQDKEIRVGARDFDIDEIDRIAKNIIEENFDNKTKDVKACKFCPMKFYCDRA